MIQTKAESYEVVMPGIVCNTVPHFHTIEAWKASGYADKYAWGIRDLRPGGRARYGLDAKTVEAQFPAYPEGTAVIALMVDRVCPTTAWLEIWDSPTGMIVEGIEYPDIDAGWNWRGQMPDPTKRKAWYGTAARMMLRKHLNANDLDDLAALQERYPGHVIEISAMEREFGTIPGRRGVVWECRSY